MRILFLFLLLFCNNVFAQPRIPKPKYTYNTEYISMEIRCHELYERDLQEWSYIDEGWKEYDYYYTHVTNIKFSSSDYYDIWVTFERKDSTLIKK